MADLVWSRLGDCRNFIEPFCGSLAMLLCRPHAPKIETVNDVNSFIANFWRAIQRDPGAVAFYADGPVNETDLHARHNWLVRSRKARAAMMRVRYDPDYFHAKVAGWWCHGACMWIGSGWCEQQIPHMDESRGIIGRQFADPENRLSGKIPELGGGFDGRGVVRSGEEKRPQLCNGNTTYGVGVHKKPILTSDGGTGDKGINSITNLREQSGNGLGNQRIYLTGDGKGNKIARGAAKLVGSAGFPQLADAYSRGRGVHGHDEYTGCEKCRLWLIDWFTRLSDRLRPVRVCCGHWDRVCDSHSTLTQLGLIGVFLDPPYRKKLSCGKENRAAHIYANDKTQDVDKLCDEVQTWCLKWDCDKDIRIAVCGLEGEYPELDRAGWDKFAWRSQGGYGNRNKENDNAARERIWFNASCLSGSESRQSVLQFSDPENTVSKET